MGSSARSSMPATVATMPLTRRAAIKGVVATTVGAFTGASVYGTAYERHALELTEADLSAETELLAAAGLKLELGIG